MFSGIIAAIVLSFVGIVKLPFGKFKTTHKNGYKAVFTALSFVLSIALCVCCQLFILEGALLTYDFAILVSSALASVLTCYTSYEGYGLKALVKKLTGAIAEAKKETNDKKIAKYLDNVSDIDKAISALVDKKNNKNGEV